MSKSVGLGLLTLSLLTLSAGASFADYQLNILHINDFHSRDESINKFDATCTAEEETKKECFGGAARLKTEIDERRKALAGQNVILLDAGDNFQGSLFYTTYRGQAEVEFLNDMKFDAMTVGNHEFDDGESALAPFLDKVQFPVVTANLATDAESKLGNRIKPSVVLDIGGQKIGIVGAVTTETPELAAPGPHAKSTDDVAAINAEGDKLKQQGVNKILRLTICYIRTSPIARSPVSMLRRRAFAHTVEYRSKGGRSHPTMVDNPAAIRCRPLLGSFSRYSATSSRTRR